MAITVKKGKNGFYVDQPHPEKEKIDRTSTSILQMLKVDPIHIRPNAFNYLRDNQKGCDCPLQGGTSWVITDVQERKLYLAYDRDRKLIGVSDLGSGLNVEEFTLDDDHGFWLFCNTR